MPRDVLLPVSNYGSNRIKTKRCKSLGKYTWQQGFLKQKNKVVSIPLVHDDGA